MLTKTTEKVDMFEKIVLPRSSSLRLKKVVLRAPRDGCLKGLFKSKPRTPADVVRQTRSLLIELESNAGRGGTKRDEKMAELNKLIQEMKSILYGNDESEPDVEACAQLTQEFFRDNTLRLLIICLPKLNLEARNEATQVVANLQRQLVHSHLIASDYLEINLDLMDHLISGHVLESEHMKKFFDYIQLPNFDVAADSAATFKDLLTRHKSTVAEFLSRNYNWLLGDLLLNRSNSAVMVRYVSSKDSLRIIMNLMRESSKNIQMDAFHVFKLFVANENKPPDIVNVLVANRSKLLRLLGVFKADTGEDQSFEADKAEVVKEIAELEPQAPVNVSGELYKDLVI
ncbi:unnamed protein product [Ilex paraguariensis]|uniref:MO25-like protein n=1 Tax=Ilex paraguariensis TaxID=185542 RepID=A0ABC8T3V5_9AQUA